MHEQMVVLFLYCSLKLLTLKIVNHCFHCDVYAMSFQAVDLDERKSITYTIIRGDTGKFAIDENSGAITTRDELDFERQADYTLIVSTREVFDEAEPEYTATVVVAVLVRIDTR